MKFFNLSKIIALLLVFLWPVGVVFYWAKSKSKIFTKLALSVISLVFWLIVISIVYTFSFSKDKALVGEALARLDRQDTTSAINYLNQAIAKNPEYSYAYSKRGDLYLSMEQYDKALTDFNFALQYAPKEATSYLEKGQCLFEMGRYKEAMENYDMAIALNPDIKEYYVIKVTAFYKTNQFEKGLTVCDEALSKWPRYAELYLLSGGLKYELGRLVSSIEDFSTAIKLDPASSEALYLRGITYDKINEHEKGCNDIQAAANLGYEEAILRYKEHCQKLE